MPTLCILEDDARRTAEMLGTFMQALCGWDCQLFPTARETIAYLQKAANDIRLISLDHDLEPQTPTDGDPGTGRDVANYLATQPPFAPVLVHSTNIPAAVGMCAVLDEGRWYVERITPYADLQWIGELWLPTIARLGGCAFT